MHTFLMDLAEHERTRLAAVLETCEDTYDPIALLADERAAHALLYGDLDEAQQATFDRLVAAGVL